ncbi:MAG: Flp pilus assembly protein CpaB [Proteobacteria bacterium]|nr:Flp pilus assembly protein CpaB [Pseudomonadota bacterium]
MGKLGKIQKIIGGMLILLALGLAAYAWTISNRMAAEQRQAQLQMQPVVVAAVRIPAGTVMTPEMLRLSGFPTPPEGSYADIKGLVGKPVASDVALGEPLLKERVEGNTRVMLQHLESGERAMAIRVDDVIAVGNRLSPGDLVDAYVTLRRNNDEIPDTQSRLVLEKLRILAFGNKDGVAAKEAGSSVRSAVDNPKTAVLAVKLPDVDKLMLAAETGRLLLALRPPEAPPAAAGDAPTEAAPKLASTAAKMTPVTLTLRELVATPKSGERSGRLASPVVKSGAAPGKTVSVLHGLKEKSVYLETKQTEARP